ncbi:hypothetical protein A9R01_13785 ['Osedax' symbiont bacterium Rs2_46_30_T18]|nr:hypothetical protein A9R01_13785 ['Osedax' symbiont bacterium Rs2_46_30_T18]
MEPAKALANVADVRCLGAIGVIELTRAVDSVKIQQQFTQRGVWVRPFGKLVYVMPAYVMQPETLQQLTAAMVEVVASH